jgi:phosphatidylserine/phosphatidylglycerophosphate/cardiolipin synthase-like enzyme
MSLSALPSPGRLREPSDLGCTLHKESGMPSRSFIVSPDDSAAPILDAINRASKSLRVKMFTFSDPSLMQAVIAAHSRGVKVQII